MSLWNYAEQNIMSIAHMVELKLYKIESQSTLIKNNNENKLKIKHMTREEWGGEKKEAFLISWTPPINNMTQKYVMRFDYNVISVRNE